MKQKKILTFTLVLTVILMLIAGTGYSQVRKINPDQVKKPIGAKKKIGLFKKMTAIVVVINCRDRYLEVSGPNCRIYKIGISPTKCNSLNLKLYDQVRIIYKGKIKRNRSGKYEIDSIKVTKKNRSFLICSVKVVNCNDNYIDLSYKLCRRPNILVRAGIPRNDCIRYNLNTNDRVKIFGVISYDTSHNRLTINNVTRVEKL